MHTLNRLVNATVIDNYSVFVNLLTIMLGILAIAVTGGIFAIYQILSHKFQEEAASKANKAIKANIANLYNSIGYMYWRDYEATKHNAEYLEEAIQATRNGLAQCKDLDEEGNEELFCRLRNNLASYLIYRNPNQEGDKEVVEDCVRYVRSKLSKYPEHQDDCSDTIKEANKKFALNL